MPEHWSGALSGPWRIKRDRLRILADSWEAFSNKCMDLASALDRASATVVDNLAISLPEAPPLLGSEVLPRFSWCARPLSVDPVLLAIPLGGQIEYQCVDGLGVGNGKCLAIDFVEVLKRQIARQSDGFFTVGEAACILAGEHQTQDVSYWRKHIYHAYRIGELPIRGPNRVKVIELEDERPHYDLLKESDVHSWLAADGGGAAFPTIDKAESHPEPRGLPVDSETPERRRARWLDLYGKGERGAVQRVYEHARRANPKVDRSFVGKEIKKAKQEKANAIQSSAMYGQLTKVSGGKRNK
jgi:hypothetical protein